MTEIYSSDIHHACYIPQLLRTVFYIGTMMHHFLQYTAIQYPLCNLITSYFSHKASHVLFLAKLFLINRSIILIIDYFINLLTVAALAATFTYKKVKKKTVMGTRVIATRYLVPQQVIQQITN